MWEWILWLVGDDWRRILVWALGAIGSAIAGGFIKWLLDRKLINELKRQGEVALLDLAKREAADQIRKEKLEELQRLVDGKQIDVAAEQSRLDQLLTTLGRNEAGLWTTFHRSPPLADYDARIGRRRPVVITVANNKGGVSKTTIVGNLLAYFDNRLKLRVLVIDLDYQGSLSTMLRAEQDRADARQSSVNELLLPGAGLGTLHKATRPLGQRLSRSRLAPAFYELALLEDRLMVEWLLQSGGDDVRYRLADVLLQYGEEYGFDIVLIDCPPRLTTGTINALCASTHVLIPTIFNPTSAEPVANFLQTSKALMDQLNPKLEFLGVVETLTPPANQGRDARAEARRVITERLNEFPGIHILNADVPRRASISEGGVAYLDDAGARTIFTTLGDEIKGMVGL